MGRNRGLSPIVVSPIVGVLCSLLFVVRLVILLFCRLKIDIHAAFWQLSVPKIVTLGCGFMHDASL